ncbi:MAG: methyl-accepting chemotaxis protein, partial [Limisphaerales bacterium]
AGSLTIAESAKLHASLVSDVQAMIAHCGDSSLLILDPDLDSYYLVDAAMIKLPQGQEHLTKTLLLGEDLLRRGKVNKEDQVQFTVLGAFLQEEDIQEARASVEASLQEDSAIHGTSPTLNGAISPALRDMLTTVQTVVDITGKIAAGGEISRDTFLAAGLKAKDANLALTRTALTELEKLLHIRIASFESQRFMEAGISVAALCAALLLVWAISHSITRPLRAGTQRISDSAQVLANASQELSAVSGQVSSTAEETATQGRVVADSATQVSRNIQTVATATEEMTSSISEIARNAGEASKIAGQAVASAERTNQVMARLGTSSEEIGNVLLLISNIASQTNLLALNATIEAVRAGESGKSFAVVANEVKELARQTAKATEEISRKVAAIQADTQSGIAAIREITTTVRQINDIQMVIAGAVEEQAATTSEISSNTQQAARASSEIALNIASVADAVKNTTAGATQTAASASELSRLATDLRGVVDVFKRLDASDTAVPPARQQPAAQT